MMALPTKKTCDIQSEWTSQQTTKQTTKQIIDYRWIPTGAPTCLRHNWQNWLKKG